MVWSHVYFWIKRLGSDCLWPCPNAVASNSLAIWYQLENSASQKIDCVTCSSFPKMCNRQFYPLVSNSQRCPHTITARWYLMAQARTMSRTCASYRFDVDKCVPKMQLNSKRFRKKLHHITFNWRRLSFGLLVFVSLADCFAAPSWFIFCWNFGWISEREKCGLGWQHCHCQVAANLICSSIWFTAR